MLTPFVEENLVSVSLIPVTCNKQVSDNVIKRSGQAERGSIKESLGFHSGFIHTFTDIHVIYTNLVKNNKGVAQQNWLFTCYSVMGAGAESFSKTFLEYRG